MLTWLSCTVGGMKNSKWFNLVGFSVKIQFFCSLFWVGVVVLTGMMWKKWTGRTERECAPETCAKYGISAHWSFGNSFRRAIYMILHVRIYLHHLFDQIIAASHDPTPKGSYGEKSLYFREIQVGEILHYNMARWYIYIIYIAMYSISTLINYLHTHIFSQRITIVLIRMIIGQYLGVIILMVKVMMIIPKFDAIMFIMIIMVIVISILTMMVLLLIYSSNQQQQQQQQHHRHRHHHHHDHHHHHHFLPNEVRYE